MNLCQRFAFQYSRPT